jgi:antitoxin MazE
MKVKVIQVGNSKGLRLPKTVLKKYGITESIDMELRDDAIVLRPVKQARVGWEESFAVMHASGDDELLIDDVFPDEVFDD